MKNTEKNNEQLLEKNENEKAEKTPEKTIEEKKAEFAKLISGEYKEVFEAMVSEKLEPGTKENAQLKDKLRQSEEILEMLSDRYSSASPEELKKAIQADNSLFAENAG